MRPTTTLAAAAIVLAGLALAAPPFEAACVSARLVTSGFSYVFTPGCENVYCGFYISSVTDDIVGSFWALGDGDEQPGVGIDNGTFAPKDGWVLLYPGYAAPINTTWAASTAIDGCIDFAEDPQRCMAILLMDRHPMSGDGVFALMTRAPDDLINYDFEQPGDIVLAGLGRPEVTRIQFVDPSIVSVTVAGVDTGDVEAGLYLDPACAAAPAAVQGFRFFTRVLPQTAEAPTDSDVEQWEPMTDVVPLGQPISFEVDCRDQESMWIRSALVFDSGFTNLFLSEQSTRIECSRTLAEPEDPEPRKPRNRERRRGRAARP